LPYFLYGLLVTRLYFTASELHFFVAYTPN